MNSCAHIDSHVLHFYSGNASDDVLPVSGMLQFVTGITQQTLVLSILPDTTPELDEVSLNYFSTNSSS